MDPPDINSPWDLVGVLWDCLGWGDGPLEKVGMPNNILDFFSAEACPYVAWFGRDLGIGKKGSP